MTAIVFSKRHCRLAIAMPCVICAALSVFFAFALVSAPMAQAAPSAAQAVATCNPTSSNGCVNGILQDAGKSPIAGATVTLSGAETGMTATAADGTWAFSVADDGDYTVTIDATVASQHGLAASSATVTIKKSSFDKQRAVVRFDQANSAAGASNASGSASAASGTA